MTAAESPARTAASRRGRRRSARAAGHRCPEAIHPLRPGRAGPDDGAGAAAPAWGVPAPEWGAPSDGRDSASKQRPADAAAAEEPTRTHSVTPTADDRGGSEPQTRGRRWRAVALGAAAVLFVAGGATAAFVTRSGESTRPAAVPPGSSSGGRAVTSPETTPTRPARLRCTRSTAKRELRERNELDDADTPPREASLPDLARFACADLDGDGQEEMVFTRTSAGSMGLNGWGLFVADDGEWKLEELDDDAVRPGFAIRGRDLEIAEVIYAEGDANASPTGGTSITTYRLRDGELRRTDRTTQAGAFPAAYYDDDPIQTGPRAEPLSDTSPITTEGIGPLLAGMTKSEAEAAAQTEIEYGGAAIGECRQASITGLDEINVLLTDGVVGRIDTTSESYATRSGVSVGDTEARVREVYGERIRTTQNEYVPDGSYLTYTPADSSDDTRIVFVTDGDAGDGDPGGAVAGGGVHRGVCVGGCRRPATRGGDLTDHGP